MAGKYSDHYFLRCQANRMTTIIIISQGLLAEEIKTICYSLLPLSTGNKSINVGWFKNLVSLLQSFLLFVLIRLARKGRLLFWNLP